MTKNGKKQRVRITHNTSGLLLMSSILAGTKANDRQKMRAGFRTVFCSRNNMIFQNTKANKYQLEKVGDRR